jgi:hypothetical protein
LATTWRSLELARVTGDTAWEAAMQARLTTLYQAAAVAPPAAPGAVAAAAGAVLPTRLARWVSSLWVPEWVVVTAEAIPPQTQVFALEDGEITLTCAWYAASQNTPATLHVSWRANLATPSDLWVRFTQPDTATPLAELRLGTALEGLESFTPAVLGFDPSRERWALAILLRDLAS